MIERVVTIGEGLAVFRSDPGEPLWQVDRVAVGTGGAEANVAMTLAHRGLPVTWCGRIGDDALGRRVVRELRAEGVTVRTVVDSQRPTGLLVKDARADGRTTVSYYRTNSAGSALSPADAADLIGGVGGGTLVHVTGVTCALSETAKQAVLRTVAAAKDAGALVSFDVNHRSRLWNGQSPVSTYRKVAALADLVFASVDEVAFLTDGPEKKPAGDDLDSALDALRRAGYDHAVVTAGAAGAAAVHEGKTATEPAQRVTAVDTVGAGDAFVGGYLASWARGGTLSNRLRAGAVSGAAACRHGGDWEGATDLTGLSPDDVGADPVVR